MLYLTITVDVDIMLNENSFLNLFLEKEGLPNAINSAEMNFINALIQGARV